MVKGEIANGLRRFYEFGEFRLDAKRHRLLRAGTVVPLPPKAIETLVVFVQNPGKVLQREDLMQAVWADTIVEDANLTVAISQLRKALNQNDDSAEFIQTIPRVGYRFVADLRDVVEEPAALIAEKRTPQQSIVAKEFIFENGAGSETAPPRNAESDEAGFRTGAIPEAKGLLPNGQMALVASGQPRLRRWTRSRTLAAVSILALGVIGSLIYLRVASKPRLPANTAEVKSIAVLPLKTIGTKPEDQYLGLGLADALITQLGRIRQIAIRPIGSVQPYAGRERQDPLAVGRELGVETVLEGSVQHEGDTLRVTMRLLRVGDGIALWSGKFDEKFTNIFAMQDSISEQVAQAAMLNLSKEERDLLTKRHTASVQAYQLYLKGRYFWNKRTTAGLERSLDYFNQAIEIDPGYALAYAGLADTCALLVWQGEFPRREFIPRAKAAAIKALEIDETLGEAHTSLGAVKFWYEWDFAGAESEYRRAIELNPNYATAHHWYAEFLLLMGRSNEGFKELKLAQQADPLSLIINADIGRFFSFAHQQDRAIEQLQKTLEMDPQFPLAHLFLAMAYNQKGMHENAIAALEKQAKSPASRAIFKAALGYIYAQSGQEAEAMSVLKELKELPSPEQSAPAFGIALIYVGLGEKDQALEWLEKAKTEHDPFLIYIKADPNFDSLRSDSRFADLMRGVGLEE